MKYLTSDDLFKLADTLSMLTKLTVATGIKLGSFADVTLTLPSEETIRITYKDDKYVAMFEED